MLCEASSFGFIATWAILTVLGLLSTCTLSGILFVQYYARPTYEKWRTKSNPKFPSARMVRDEILQMIKGTWTATICPALAICLAQSGRSHAFCGFDKYGLGYQAMTFVAVWIGSDFWEFFYHHLGHRYKFFWAQHKYHHFFYNPSPFAVIADEYVDQFVRSAPMLIFPMLFPVNMDMVFAQFGVFFYAYGVYLHWGYELNWPDAHHPWINTSFQHYCHHAKSIYNKPFHTGFFFKCWDQMFGTMYDKDCFCAKCSCAKGERTLEAWQKIDKPDYSVLLQPSFWLSSPAQKTDA